jgi:glycosyltransferase involved in cell wall biosynthesis
MRREAQRLSISLGGVLVRPAPRLSVLMPAFNCRTYVAEAIDSVLAQSFGDFEFLIVDDGSTDGTQDVLLEYARRDARVRLSQNPRNIGIADTLNAGLQQCRGEYIARMDADDICHVDRFRKQIDFLEAHADIGVCGTAYEMFGASSGTCRHPQTDAEIKVLHLLGNTAIGHPTALFRRDAVIRSGAAFNRDEFPAEDLWFWIRLGFATKLANLSETLLRYRVHDGQVSKEKMELQREKAAQARLFFASRIFGRELTADEIAAHAVLSGSCVKTTAELTQVAAYGKSLADANAASKVIDQSALTDAIAATVANLPRQYAETNYKYRASFGLPLLFAFFRDPFRPVRCLSAAENVKFIAKCMLHHRKREQAR